MAPAAIYSVLAKDTDTNVAIGQELADMSATPQEVTATFAVLAAAMLAEACGGTAEARRLAARWTRKITEREARVVAARSARHSLTYISISASSGACASRPACASAVASGCA